MAMHSIIPLHYDHTFIFEQAGVDNHFGVGLTEDGRKKIGYHVDDADAVITTLENYEISYADSVERPKLVAKVADIRWNHQQRFVFDGVETWAHPAVLDVTATIVSMQVAGEEGDSIPWKLAPGVWRLWTIHELVVYGQSIRAHVQACFTREEMLYQELAAAQTVEQLRAIDLESGWPGQTPAE